jgi:hypothetical protein
MSLDAVSFARINGAGTFAAKHVCTSRNSLKMQRENTQAITTEMVKGEARRNAINERFIS